MTPVCVDSCCFIDVLLVGMFVIKREAGFTTLGLQVEHDGTILRAREHPLDVQ